MTARVASDHESVRTVDATLARVGRLDRPRIEVPPGAEEVFPVGEVVRLIVDGTQRFTAVERSLSGEGVELRGAAPTPDAAREGDGSAFLADWRADHGVPFGNTVHVDVVDPGFRYGLRAPGERAVYDAGTGDADLQNLARDLLE